MTTIPFLRFLRCGLCFFVLRYIDIDYVLRLINTITIRALFVLLGYFLKGLFVIKGFGLQHTSENTSSARFYKKNGRLNVHHKTNYSKTTAHSRKLSRSTTINFQFAKSRSKQHRLLCKFGPSFQLFLTNGYNSTRRSCFASKCFDDFKSNCSIRDCRQ